MPHPLHEENERLQESGSTATPARDNPQEAVIQTSGLRMRYGKREVLDGVDLHIFRGELFGLLGPNGAGKSTTIEILEGYRRRSAGQATVLGQDPETSDAAWRARIGIVLQSSRDHGRWRVAELLHHVARYYPHPLDPMELLSTVGLAPQAGQQMAKLSGGQRRRLDVALGIIGRPELLFLDEPTTGFDPEARRDFHALLRKLRDERGMTIVLTTHDMVEAQHSLTGSAFCSTATSPPAGACANSRTPLKPALKSAGPTPPAPRNA
ncbi:ABC transporter ATP-binding protein [Streptomyces sp. SID685]|uniref:ABC transporter ATP-binding protein n=1 Tax=Streptomyces sp. SID685 TaxID=2690322 RepID=UPI0031FE9F88